MERSLVLIKPDAMQRGLAGSIVGRLEEQGLKLVALKMLHMDRALAERHYSIHRDKPFYKDLVDRVKLHGEEMSFRFELYNPLMDDSVFPLEAGTFERSRSGIRTPYWFLEYPLGATQTALDKSMSSFLEALEADYFPRQPKKNIDYKCRYCCFYPLCWGRY